MIHIIFIQWEHCHVGGDYSHQDRDVSLSRKNGGGAWISWFVYFFSLICHLSISVRGGGLPQHPFSFEAFYLFIPPPLVYADIVVPLSALPTLVRELLCFPHCDHCPSALFLKPSLIHVHLLFLGPECALPTHSASPSYHHNHQNHYHYPQNPPASPALLVHTECPRDCPLDDTMHQSVLHMPHHLGTAP